MKFKMKFRKNDLEILSIFLILTSFLGLIFLVAMYMLIPSQKSYYNFQKPLIICIFILICILGIMAAWYPSKCKRLMEFGAIDNKDEKNLKMGEIRFEGHHPDCGKFEPHILRIKGKKYCPGCTGLSIGAFMAILGILIYYFFNFPVIYLEIAFWIGVGTVFLALFLIIFIDLGKKLKLTANLALVLGSLLILMGIDTLKQNIIIDFYFIILVIFWILTRISISEINHELICQECREESLCIYE